MISYAMDVMLPCMVCMDMMMTPACTAPPKRARLHSGSAAVPQQPHQQRPQPEWGDLQDRAARQPRAPVPGGQGWQVVSDSSLDRRQRVLAWRILHGKLRLGAFLRQTGHGHAGSARLPHAFCSAVLATLTFNTVTCPLAAAVVAQVFAT